jgi:hypothetical protein
VTARVFQSPPIDLQSHILNWQAQRSTGPPPVVSFRRVSRRWEHSFLQLATQSHLLPSLRSHLRPCKLQYQPNGGHLDSGRYRLYQQPCECAFLVKAAVVYIPDLRSPTSRGMESMELLVSLVPVITHCQYLTRLGLVCYKRPATRAIPADPSTVLLPSSQLRSLSLWLLRCGPSVNLLQLCTPQVPCMS